MRFLRYPGGKSKLLNFLNTFLPTKEEIEGNYIEPFVGGGSVFLSLKPNRALLADINHELIELYKGIRNYPHKVWETFSSFPEGRKAFYELRDSDYTSQPLHYRAARILYLNRTCFKGMWRHGVNGNFNVGYGGEGRRWAINHSNIIELSKILKQSKLVVADFERILDHVQDGDFIFLDPPYKPGQKELRDAHYSYGKFTYNDQVRLSTKLKQISKERKIKWMMTNSSHSDICKIYKEFKITNIPKGTSDKIGVFTYKPQEVLISNF